MDQVTFEFKKPEGIFRGLERCGVGSVGKFTDNHLVPFRELADRLQVTRMARQNMETAGYGYDDLVVILLEPCDREDALSHAQIMSDPTYSSTMRVVNDSLQFAFRGVRSFDNTIILDSRTFRSRKIREKEGMNPRSRNDSLAHEALLDSLDILRPKCVIVCHCDNSGISNGLPSYLCSSPEKAGCTELIQLPGGHQCIKVSSTHPMFVQRATNRDRSVQRVMREYLFDATIVVAANILAGRQLTGHGISDVRDVALRGPVLAIGEDGPIWLFRLSDEDTTPQAVIDRLKSLGIYDNEDDAKNSKYRDLLITYKQGAGLMKDQGISVTTKRDPISVFWPY